MLITSDYYYCTRNDALYDCEYFHCNPKNLTVMTIVIIIVLLMIAITIFIIFNFLILHPLIIT